VSAKNRTSEISENHSKQWVAKRANL